MKNKKLLIVVDFQKDFVNGSLGFKGAEKLYPRILDRVNEYKANGDYVVFTMDTHGEEYLSTVEGKYLPIEHCIKGTEGHKIYGDDLKAIAENDNTIKICKEKFGTLELMKLREQFQDVGEVELCGIDTNICVLSNAIIAQTVFSDCDICIRRELCGSGNKELEEKTFEVMKNLQIQVV
ncbi:Nicotinamidase-related amidase [Hathewaya proteolytica DSM 3090]|uniref:nicotinamidase n=1 Tax=Hathewaya proteolytica DSM 3090 TaxID=1121331 RepID=A0A1M6MD61_9CLOT|nr:isochorismatase family cysteine hydrolase [Hathewaya proteolytica]SHJ81356.1 Nicotinamidase-related amidase [Hathewaya proteolytica DSM 3090]